jgi:hypothetical protein
VLILVMVLELGIFKSYWVVAFISMGHGVHNQGMVFKAIDREIHY